MTDEEINITIAEVCGWTDFFVHPEFGLTGIEPNTHELRTVVPWYVCDLNAMHEAEEVLLWNEGPGVWECYRNKLRGKYGEDDIHTTARQRAEAFLRTLGKWEGPTTEESSAVQKEEA